MSAKKPETRQRRLARLIADSDAGRRVGILAKPEKKSAVMTHANGAVQGVVRKTMRPGERGTGRFVRDWGDRLVCVRYRFDAKGRIRYTTVEIVTSELRPWSPPRRPTPGALVYLRIDPNDWKAIQRLRDARAWWDRERLLWRTRYDVAERLRLRSRIVAPTRTPLGTLGAPSRLPDPTRSAVPGYAHRQVTTNRNLGHNSG